MVVACAAGVVAAGIGGCSDDSDESGRATSQAAVGETQILTALDAASQYLQAQRHDEAEQILARLTKMAPDDARGHELLGQLHYTKAMIADQRGETAAAQVYKEQAADSYAAAASAASDSAGLQHSAALILLAAGRADHALAHFQKAAALDPANPQHPLFAAQVRLQRGEWAEAEELLQRALRVDGEEPYVHASFAVLALEQGRNDEAIAHIAKARELDPDDLSLRVQQARVFRRAGDPRRSLELLVPLAANARAQLGVSEEIAAAYMAAGDARRAGAQWQEAHAAARGWRDKVHAARGAAESLLADGERDEALRWITIARRAEAMTDEQRVALDELEARVRASE